VARIGRLDYHEPCESTPSRARESNLADRPGYAPPALVPTAFAAAASLLVPLVPIDAIPAAAQAPSRSSRSTACLADS